MKRRLKSSSPRGGISFGKTDPHFFYRAAVPERIAFFHAAVKFRIHIAVRVELGTDARTSCRVAPQEKNSHDI